MTPTDTPKPTPSVTCVSLDREVIDLLAFAALDLQHPDAPEDSDLARRTARLLRNAQSVVVTLK